MTPKTHLKPIAALVGSAFIATLGLAGTAHADGEPLFVAHDLDGGYLLAAADDAEGKCGEGKCGESGDTDSAEGSCGESGDADSAEGSCGEATDGEGSCGEA